MSKKICVILHLYYFDMWESVLTYIENIKHDFDLYITLTNNKEEHIINDIKDKIMNSVYGDKVKNIFVLNNKGMDIGPFLYVMSYLVKNNINYDLLLKIHTKKSIHEGRSAQIGKMWNDELYNSILGTSDKVDGIINIFDKNEDIGVVGSKKWLINRNHPGFYYNHNYINYFIEKFNIKTKMENMVFIGGTMFWSNYNVLFNFFKQYDPLLIMDELEEGAITDSVQSRKTHSIERIIGLVYLDDNKKIIGV